MAEYFRRVKLDEHGPVGLKLFDGYAEAEIVEEEELEFEVVELAEGEAADLYESGLASGIFHVFGFQGWGVFGDIPSRNDY